MKQATDLICVTVSEATAGGKRRDATSASVAICRAVSEREGRQTSGVVGTFSIVESQQIGK
jgi:hypothetical protein